MTGPSDAMIEAAAARLRSIHWDGTGCGTNGHMGCAHCFGPSPLDEREISREVLAAVLPLVREQIAEEILTACNALEHLGEGMNFRHGIREAARIARGGVS